MIQAALLSEAGTITTIHPVSWFLAVCIVFVIVACGAGMGAFADALQQDPDPAPDPCEYVEELDETGREIVALRIRLRAFELDRSEANARALRAQWRRTGRQVAEYIPTLDDGADGQGDDDGGDSDD